MFFPLFNLHQTADAFGGALFVFFLYFREASEKAS
jgi:hypothetical protein